MERFLHSRSVTSVTTSGKCSRAGVFHMFLRTAFSGCITRKVVAAIFATVVSVPVSFAQVPAKDRLIPSITVGYADLNLAKPEGSRVLYQRLADAARRVCPETGYVTELRQNRDAQHCISDTVERA